MNEITNTNPPKEVYDLLHKYDESNIDIPRSVKLWWEKETILNEMIKEADRLQSLDPLD